MTDATKPLHLSQKWPPGSDGRPQSRPHGTDEAAVIAGAAEVVSAAAAAVSTVSKSPQSNATLMFSPHFLTVGFGLMFIESINGATTMMSGNSVAV